MQIQKQFSMKERIEVLSLPVTTETNAIELHTHLSAHRLVFKKIHIPLSSWSSFGGMIELSEKLDCHIAMIEDIVSKIRGSIHSIREEGDEYSKTDSSHIMRHTSNIYEGEEYNGNHSNSSKGNTSNTTKGNTSNDLKGNTSNDSKVKTSMGNNSKVDSSTQSARNSDPKNVQPNGRINKNTLRKDCLHIYMQDFEWPLKYSDLPLLELVHGFTDDLTVLKRNYERRNEEFQKKKMYMQCVERLRNGNIKERALMHILKQYNYRIDEHSHRKREQTNIEQPGMVTQSESQPGMVTQLGDLSVTHVVRSNEVDILKNDTINGVIPKNDTRKNNRWGNDTPEAHVSKNDIPKHKNAGVPLVDSNHPPTRDPNGSNPREVPPRVTEKCASRPSEDNREDDEFLIDVFIVKRLDQPYLPLDNLLRIGTVCSEGVFELVHFLGLKGKQEEIKHLCDEKGWTLKEQIDEEFMAEDAFKLYKKNFYTFLSTYMLESMQLLACVKLTKLYTDSVLKYGLPVSYVFFLVVLDERAWRRAVEKFEFMRKIEWRDVPRERFRDVGI